MNDDTPVHDEEPRSSTASTLSWIALAAAILIAGFLVRDRLDPSMLRPGGETAGLPAIGSPAPDFEAINSNGEFVALSDFEGQPVWLNFWGAWCPPCRAEIPDMIQAYRQLEPEGIALVAVSLEEPSDEAFAYAKSAGMDFVVLSDPVKAAIAGKYRVRSFPTHILIDEHGIVQDIVTTTMSTQTALNFARQAN